VGTLDHVTNIRRDTEKSAHSERKEYTYTQSIVKSQGMASASVHRVSARSAQVTLYIPRHRRVSARSS
jgi:hypothetical protein